MPIRIYALAKDLNIDSKDLVDACTKAGITGKGSALASLDDDEVAKVKDFLAGPKQAPAARGPARPVEQGPISREDYIPAGSGSSKIRVIPKTTRPAKSDSAPASVDETPVETETPVAESPAESPAVPVEPVAPVEVETPAPVVSAPVAPAEPVEAPAPAAEAPAAPVAEAPAPQVAPHADAPVRPAPGMPERRSIRDLTPRTVPPLSQRPAPLANRGLGGGAGGGEKGKPKPKPKPRAPVIKLPDLPTVAQPADRPKSELPAQKPTIRLTSDAFTGRRRPQDTMTPTAPGAAPAAGAKADATGKSPLGARGRGKKPGDDEEDRRSLAGMVSVRPDRAPARKRKRREDRDDDGVRGRTLTHRGRNTAAPRKDAVGLSVPCTVREFCEASGVGVGAVMKTLMVKMQVQANINAMLDEETAQLLAAELNIELEFKRPETVEDSVIAEYEAPDDEATLQPRPPIVTFLGHVDHGKTSLLDYLIGTNVVAGEAGGITQHIRAYSVETKDGRTVSFVDTPGHEAFTEMRARGANVTDIVVLVVAADDGIMPQTEEAISHAKAAGVPIVVALNKMDLPGANPQRVLTQMTEHELTPSEWGGDVEVVRTSAITGAGMDDLLETLLTIAELNDLKANPDRSATGTCLEAEQEPGRGVIAKLMVRNGTLKVGDNIVCGSAHGRIKAMYHTLDRRKRVTEAPPSTPVNVTGFDEAPAAGETFYVVEDIAVAREIAERRAASSRDSVLGGRGDTKVTFQDFQSMLASGRLGGGKEEVAQLNLIVRADVRGSIEAINKELEKFHHPEVQIKRLQSSVGGVTVADVQLAHASQGVIVGFNVIPDEAARSLADDLGVEIRRYDIIYKLTEDIKAMIEGKLKPEERIIELGRAVVKEVFQISRVGVVAGCYVIQGTIERGARIRVNREGRTIGDYAMESLRRIKEDVKEVPRGMECGIKLSNFSDVKKDDLLEAYRIEEVARTL